MLLTQEGLRALEHFSLSAWPQYGEDLKRIEGNDGLMLTCHACSGRHDGPWMKQWPGHVAAPDLRHLVIVAEQHWNEAHREDEPKTGEAEAPEEVIAR